MRVSASFEAWMKIICRFIFQEPFCRQKLWKFLWKSWYPSRNLESALALPVSRQCLTLLCWAVALWSFLILRTYQARHCSPRNWTLDPTFHSIGLTLALIQHKLRELNKKLDLLLDCNKKTAKDKLSEALNALEHENFHDAFEEFKKAGDKGWSVGQAKRFLS